MGNEWERITNAAQRLHITRVTLWRWVKAGKIRSRRIGKNFLVATIDIDNLIIGSTTQKSPTPEGVRPEPVLQL